MILAICGGHSGASLFQIFRGDVAQLVRAAES